LKHEYEIKKTVDLPTGGSITVTVSSPEPIQEKDFPILQAGAAIQMGASLISLANTLRPPVIQ
jgi:hypothetical protein